MFGGDQMRPNIHIEDVTDLYVNSLEWPEEKIDGNVFNAGYDNQKIMEIAKIAKGVVGEDVEIVTTPTDDHRSYHISSEKIKRELGFEPKFSTKDAVVGLVSAFNANKIPNALEDPRYYNIKTMQALRIK